jgi:hypothetical protein
MIIRQLIRLVDRTEVFTTPAVVPLEQSLPLLLGACYYARLI